MGERVGGEPADEAGNFMKCPVCGGYFDICTSSSD